ASPSSVVISTPCTAEIGRMHERTASPLMMTVHAPHWPRPQPNRGPCRSRSLRSTYKRGVAGSTSTVWDFPLTLKLMLAMPLVSVLVGRRPSGIGPSAEQTNCVTDLLYGRLGL